MKGCAGIIIITLLVACHVIRLQARITVSPRHGSVRAECGVAVPALEVRGIRNGSTIASTPGARFHIAARDGCWRNTAAIAAAHVVLDGFTHLQPNVQQRLTSPGVHYIDVLAAALADSPSGGFAQPPALLRQRYWFQVVDPQGAPETNGWVHQAAQRDRVQAVTTATPPMPSQLARIVLQAPPLYRPASQVPLVVTVVASSDGAVVPVALPVALCLQARQADASICLETETRGGVATGMLQVPQTWTGLVTGQVTLRGLAHSQQWLDTAAATVVITQSRHPAVVVANALSIATHMAGHTPRLRIDNDLVGYAGCHTT